MFEQYGVTEEEVLQWGKEKYPQFLSNKTLLLQLYLRSKGKRIDFPLLTGAKKVDVANLKVGEWVIIEVAVVSLIRRTPYKACPTCYRSTTDGMCPRCGKVTPVEVYWEEYLAGDSTGEVALALPPRVAMRGEELEGKIVRCRGVLRDTGEFSVQSLQILPGGTAMPKIEVPSPAPSPQVSPPQAPIQEEAEVSQPPVQEVPPSEETATREAADLKKILDIFGEVEVKDLEAWHASRKMVTPLTVLIEMVGERVGDRVRARK